MHGIDIVTVVVTLGSIALCGLPYLRPLRALGEWGRHGGIWFARSEDREIEERPSEDVVDAPIPRRRLRARLD